MDVLTIITVLIITSAAFSYFNQRFIKLPGTIGIMTISVVVSLLILIIGTIGNKKSSIILELAHNVDFSTVLLDILLGFLLFASALHFDYRKLKAQRMPVFFLSTVGVLVSASIFGALLYGVSSLLKIDLPLIYCFIFGALISPTDPIAVGSILKKSRIPTRLETIISGESLFNDGVGLVLFIALSTIPNPEVKTLSFLESLQLFAREVFGGIAIGLVMGFIGYRLIKSIRDFQTIFLISLAIVLGISVVARVFHASIPLAAVSAGLVIGNQSFDKHHPAHKYLSRVWQLLDEVLNTILFVLIGLQLVLMPFLDRYWLIGILSIIIILIARMASVSLPALFLLRRISFGNLSILTWAGLRGGISIAMALSLPHTQYREVILASCYFIVIFSIIVQGLTLNKVVENAVGKTAPRIPSPTKS